MRGSVQVGGGTCRVGARPFGGSGLSGTGPEAGGPDHYRRALRPPGGLAADGWGGAFPLGAALPRAAGSTLLNPHVCLDTVLLVGASRPPGGQPAFVAGAGLASALWFAALGYGAPLLAPLFARPAAWRALDALVGATMLATAAGLAAHGRA